MIKIHVVAWRWNDGAGSRWDFDPEIIEKEYRAQVSCEAQLYGEKHEYKVGKFEVEIPWEVTEGQFGRMAVDMFVAEWIETNAVF